MARTYVCTHGKDLYADSCVACMRNIQHFERAKESVASLGRDLNRGGGTGVLAAAFTTEHAALFAYMAEAAALSTLTRTYESLCPEAESGRTVFDDAHPAHDGRLSCGVVIGALRTLAVRPQDDVLEARRYWLGRIYQPGWQQGL